MKIGELSLVELRFAGEAEDQLDEILRTHIETHTGVTFVDLLKFLYQSVLGSHHIFDMMQEDQIRRWVKKNLKTAEPSERPLTEKLYGDIWVRVDLEAFKTMFADDYESLTELFTKGLEEERGSTDELSNLIDTVMQLIKVGNIEPLDRSLNLLDSASDFLKEYKLKSYPPIHHSKLYSEQNPPYLVVPTVAMKRLRNIDCTIPSKLRKTPE